MLLFMWSWERKLAASANTKAKNMRALNIATNVNAYSESVKAMISPYITAPIVHEDK